MESYQTWLFQSTEKKSEFLRSKALKTTHLLQSTYKTSFHLKLSEILSKVTGPNQEPWTISQTIEPKIILTLTIRAFNNEANQNELAIKFTVKRLVASVISSV